MRKLDLSQFKRWGKVRFTCGHWDNVVYNESLEGVQAEITDHLLVCPDCNPDVWALYSDHTMLPRTS